MYLGGDEEEEEVEVEEAVEEWEASGVEIGEGVTLAEEGRADDSTGLDDGAGELDDWAVMFGSLCW